MARMLAFACALALAAAAGVGAQQGTGQHPVEPHVLGKFPFGAPVSFLDTGVQITTNISVLYATRTYVQVTVTGARRAQRLQTHKCSKGRHSSC